MTSQPLFAATAARIEQWKSRPEVLGVIHVGSRSRGHGDERSDDDLEVVLTDEAHAALSPGECSEILAEGTGPTRRIIWDAEYLPLSDLEGKRDSPHDLDHWPYELSPVVFERDPRVSAAVAAAGIMTPGFRRARLRHAAIDTRTSISRAVRTRERGAGIAARVLVHRAGRALVRVLFALEHRWVPLDHWLEPELRTLADPTGAAPRLCEGLAHDDPEPMREAIEGLGPLLEPEGVPLEPAGRMALFLELIHPSNREERSVHALD
jgi:hypothetical protein